MRITKLQNEIYKAHKLAFETNNWDSDSDQHIPIIEEMKKGFTYKVIWDSLVRNKVSITSQLMMSNDTFRYLSNKAQSDLRSGFKTFLNNLNIK